MLERSEGLSVIGREEMSADVEYLTLDMLEEAIPEDMPVIEEQALRDQVHIFPTDANLRLQTHPDGDNEWLVDLGQTLIDLGVTRLLRGSYNHLRLQRLNEMKRLILDDRTLWGICKYYGLDKVVIPIPQRAEVMRYTRETSGPLFKAYIGALYHEGSNVFGSPSAWLPLLLKPYVRAAFHVVNARHNDTLWPPPAPYIPTELHNHILAFVTSKRTLVACSLTCRYWYSICAPVLFNNVVLRNRQDVQGLKLCLQSSQPSPIKQYAHALTVIYDCKGPPWGHLVPMQIGSKLPGLRELSFREHHDHPPDPDRQDFAEPFHGHHVALLTFSAFKSLSSLRLGPCVLNSSYDILRIVGKISTLETLLLEDVQWKRNPSELPRMTRTGCRLREVQVVGCTLSWPMLWLWAAPTDPSSVGIDTFRGIAYDDAVTIGRIAASCRTTIGKHNGYLTCEMSPQDNAYILAINGIYDTADPHFRKDYMRFHIAPSSNEGHGLNVIRVVFRQKLWQDFEQAFDWEYLDLLLSTLPSLTEAVFITDDSDHNGTIFHAIRVSLPSVRRKVLYRVAYEAEDVVEPVLHPLLDAEMGKPALLVYDLSKKDLPRKYNPSATSGEEWIVPLSTQDSQSLALNLDPPPGSLAIYHETLPWPLVIESPFDPLTVRDILERIRKYLRVQITHSDWNLLTTDRQKEVARAYSRRVNRGVDTQANKDEARKGVRRIDYLIDQTMFIGLARRIDYRGDPIPNQFTLVVDKGTRESMLSLVTLDNSL